MLFKIYMNIYFYLNWQFIKAILINILFINIKKLNNCYLKFNNYNTKDNGI